MEKSWDKEKLWENSSSTPAPYFTLYTFQRTGTVTARNIMIGALGILFNTIAIIFLSLKRRLKLTLKITMLGMAINDFIFTANTLVLSNPNWTWVSHKPYCWPVMFMMASAILTSYFITILLALHNFVAVAHPLHCDEIMTRPRSVIGVFVCFASGYLVILGCLGIFLSPGVLCTVFTVMPRAGLAVECSLCLASCIVIVGLNVAISLKIKESRKVAKYGKNNKTAKEVKALPVEKICKETNQSEQSLSKNPSVKRFVKQRVSPRTQIQHLSFIKNDDMEISSSAVEQLKNTNSEMYLSQDYCQPVYSGSKESKCDLTKGISSKVDLGLPPYSGNIESSVIKFPLKSPISGGVTVKRKQTKKPVRRGKTSKTLMLLTFWSCLMSLPFVVIVVFVSFLVPDRQTFTTSDLGISIVWISTIHSIGNPLLFIWRFIDWKKVKRQVRARIGML